MSRLTALCFLISAGAFSAAHASQPACEQKAAEIQQQLEHAQANNQANRQRGLEKALANVRSHCTDADLIREQREEIAEQMEEVKEVEDDIREALDAGRTDKVRRLERKLEREREELAVLQRELEQLERVAGK